VLLAAGQWPWMVIGGCSLMGGSRFRNNDTGNGGGGMVRAILKRGSSLQQQAHLCRNNMQTARQHACSMDHDMAWHDWVRTPACCSWTKELGCSPTAKQVLAGLQTVPPQTCTNLTRHSLHGTAQKTALLALRYGSAPATVNTRHWAYALAVGCWRAA
jgi:hypothetical protein